MNLEPLYKLITTFEGLRLRSYLCPAGVWTIGYGSTGPDIIPGLVWTKEQAVERMERDAGISYRASQKLCPALDEAKIPAIADFAYNLGTTRLAGSTLRRKINLGDLDGAANEFEKWVYCGGIKLNGLKIRRAAEKILFGKES